MPSRPTMRPAGPGRLPQPSADIIVGDFAWSRALPRVVSLVARAVAAAGGASTVLLQSDRFVRRLNRVHRGIDKPTNVLTFESGDIVLAFGVIRREARAAGRGLAAHLAHLVVHGALHLRGLDHAGVGEARAMELAEARILHRLGVANPWKLS